MIIYNSQAFEIFVDYKAHSVVWKPSGLFSFEEWQESLSKGVGFLIENEKTGLNWVSDTSLYQGGKGKYVDWIIENINPRLQAVKTRNWKAGFIEPVVDLGKASILLYIAQTNLQKGNNIEACLFSNYNQVVEWISK